jgi:hypothetical protein
MGYVTMNGRTLFLIPLIPSAYLFLHLLVQQDIWDGIQTACHFLVLKHFTNDDVSVNVNVNANADVNTHAAAETPTIGLQLLAYLAVAALGYWATDQLIPIIKTYTLRKGISGKDLGKRGTSRENQEM